MIPQRLAPLLQHRTQQHQPAPLRPDGRRRPVAQAPQRRAPGPHPFALGHVIGRVAGQDDARARVPRRLGQQGVARRPRARRDAGSASRLRPEQSAPIGARRAGGFGGETGPGRAVGIEVVVDRQGQQPPPPRLRPCGGEVQQAHGVAPARQGQGDRFRSSVVQARVQPGEDPAGQVVHQLQLARVRSWVARVFCAAVAASA